MATEGGADSAPGQEARGDGEFSDAELIGIAVDNNYWRPEGSTDPVPPIDIDDVFRVAMHKVASGLPLPADVAAGIEAIYHVMHERDQPEEFERLVQDDVENAERAAETRSVAMAADHVALTSDGGGDGSKDRVSGDGSGSCSGGQAVCVYVGGVGAGDGGRQAAGQGEVSAGLQASSSEDSRGTSRDAAVREGLPHSRPGTAHCELQSAPPQQTGSCESLSSQQTHPEVAVPASCQGVVDASASGLSGAVSDPSPDAKTGTEDKARTAGSALDSSKCLTETGAQATAASKPQSSRTDAAQGTPNNAEVGQGAAEAATLDNSRQSSLGVKNIAETVDRDCVAGKEGEVSNTASASTEKTSALTVQGAQVQAVSRDNLEVSDMDLTQSDDDGHQVGRARTAGCSSQASEDSSRASMEPIVEGASPISSDDDLILTKKKKKRCKKSQQHRRRDQRKRVAALHAKLDLYRQVRARLGSPGRLGAPPGRELSPTHDQAPSLDGRGRPYIIVPNNARPYCLNTPKRGRSELYFPDHSRPRSPPRRSSPGRRSHTPGHQRRSLDSAHACDPPRVSVGNAALGAQARSERPRRFNFAGTTPSKGQGRFCSAAIANLSVTAQLQKQRARFQPIVNSSGCLIPPRRTLLGHAPPGFGSPFQGDNGPTTALPPDYSSAGNPPLFQPSTESTACFYGGSPLFASTQNSLALGGQAPESSTGTLCSTATSFAAQVHVSMTSSQAVKVGSEEESLQAIASKAHAWATMQSAQLSQMPQSVPASSAMNALPETGGWTGTFTSTALPVIAGEAVQSGFSSDVTAAFTATTRTFPQESAVPSLQNTAEGAGHASVNIPNTGCSQLSGYAVPEKPPGPCLLSTGAPGVALAASAMDSAASSAGQTMASLDGATMTTPACHAPMQAVPVPAKPQTGCQVLRDATAPVVPLSSSRRPGRWDCSVMQSAGTKQGVHAETKVVSAKSTSQPSLTHALPGHEKNVVNSATQQPSADSAVSADRDPALQVAATFAAQPQTMSTDPPKVTTTVPNTNTTSAVIDSTCEAAREGERMKPAQNSGPSASMDSMSQLKGHATDVSNITPMPAVTTSGYGSSAVCSTAQLKERPSSSSYLQSYDSQTLHARTSANEESSNTSVPLLPRQPGLLRQSSSESRTSLFEMFTMEKPASSSPCLTSTGVTEPMTPAKSGSLENQVPPQPRRISDVLPNLNSPVSKDEKDTLDPSAKTILHASKTQQSLSAEEPGLSSKRRESSSGSADERKARKSSVDGLQGATRREPRPVSPPAVPAPDQGVLEGLKMSIALPNTLCSAAIAKLSPTIPLPAGLPRFLPVQISLPVGTPGKVSALVSSADRGSSTLSPRDPRLRKRSAQKTSAIDTTNTIPGKESTKVRPPSDDSSKKLSTAGMPTASPRSHALSGKAQNSDGTAPLAEETENLLGQTQRKLSTSSTSDRPKVSARRGSKEPVKANTSPAITSADSAKALRPSTRKSSSPAGVRVSASSSGSSVAPLGKPSAGNAEDLETTRKALLQNISHLVSTLLSTQKPAKAAKDHAKPKQTQQHKDDTSIPRSLNTEEDSDKDDPVETADLDRKIEEDIIRMRRKSGLSGSTNVSTGDTSAKDAHQESTLSNSANSEETSATAESRAGSNVQSRAPEPLAETVSSAPSVSSSGRSDTDDKELAPTVVERPVFDIPPDRDKMCKEQSSCTDQDFFEKKEAKSLAETSLASEIPKHDEHKGNARTETKDITKKEDSLAQVEEKTESPALPSTQDMSIQTSDPEELEEVVQRASTSIQIERSASPCKSPVMTEQKKVMLSSEVQTSPDGPKASPENKKQTSRQQEPCSVQKVDSTKEVGERVDKPARTALKGKTARSDSNMQTETKHAKEADVSKTASSFPDSTVPSDGESVKPSDAGSHVSRKSSGTKKDAVRSRSSSSSPSSEKAIASLNSDWDLSDDCIFEDDLERTTAGRKRRGKGKGARSRRPPLRDVPRSRNLEEWRGRYWLPAHRTTSDNFMAEEEEEVVSRRTYRSLEMRRASHVISPASAYPRWPPALRMDRETHFDDRLLHEEWDRFSEHRRLSFDRDYRRTGFTDFNRRGFQHDIRDPSSDLLARRRDLERERWPHDMFEDYSPSPRKRHSLDRDGASDRTLSHARRPFTPFRAREPTDDFSSLETPAFLVTPSGKIVKMSSTYIKQVLMKDGYLDESVRRRLVDQDSPFKKEAEPERKRPRLIKPSANVAAATKIRKKWFRELYFPNRTWPARATRAPRAAAKNELGKTRTLSAQPETRHDPRSSKSSDRNRENPRSSKSSDRSRGNPRSSKSSDRSRPLTPTHRHTHSPESSRSQKLTPGKSSDAKTRATPKTDLKGKRARSRSPSRDSKKPRVEESPQGKPKAASHQRMRLEWTSRAAVLKARIAKLLATNKVESIKTEKTKVATTDKPGKTKVTADKPGKTKVATTDKPGKTKVTADKPGKTKLATTDKPGKTKVTTEKPGKTKEVIANKPGKTKKVIANKPGKTKEMTTSKRETTKEVTKFKAEKAKLGTKKKSKKAKETSKTNKPGKAKPATASKSEKTEPATASKSEKTEPATASKSEKAEPAIKRKAKKSKKSKRAPVFMPEKTKPETSIRADKVKSEDKRQDRNGRGQADDQKKADQDRALKFYSDSKVSKEKTHENRRRSTSSRSSPISETKTLKKKSKRYSSRRTRSSSSSSSASSFDKSVVYSAYVGESTLKTSGVRRRSPSPRRRRLSSRSSTPSRRSSHSRSTKYSPRRRRSSSTSSSRSSPRKSSLRRSSSRRSSSSRSSSRGRSSGRKPSRQSSHWRSSYRDASSTTSSSSSESDSESSFHSDESSRVRVTRARSPLRPCPKQPLTVCKASAPSRALSDIAETYSSPRSSYAPRSPRDRKETEVTKKVRESRFATAGGVVRKDSALLTGSTLASNEPSKQVQSPIKQAPPAIAAADLQRACLQAAILADQCKWEERKTRWDNERNKSKAVAPSKPATKKPTRFVDLFCEDSESSDSDCYITDRRDSTSSSKRQEEKNAVSMKGTKKIPAENDASSDNSWSKDAPKPQAIFTKFHRNGLPSSLEEAAEAKRPKMVPIQIIFKRRPAALRSRPGSASSKVSPEKSKAGETSSTSSERSETAVTMQSKSTSVRANSRWSQPQRRLHSKVVPVNKLVK